MGNCLTHRATKRVHKARLPFSLKGSPSCKGQALPEFALVAMTFFLLAFALIDFSWLMFNQMNMQDAVREAGRYASTGNHVPDPTTPGLTLSRVDSIKQILSQAAAGTNCVPVISNSSGAVDGAGLPNAGIPSDTVTITANCAIPLLTTAIGSFFGTDNKYHFAVSSTFKNEPFSPTQTN